MVQTTGTPDVDGAALARQAVVQHAAAVAAVLAGQRLQAPAQRFVAVGVSPVASESDAAVVR